MRRSTSRLAPDGALGQRVLPLIAFLLLSVMAVVVVLFHEQVGTVREELRQLGLVGVVVFILLQFLWTLTTVPTMPLMSVAGIVYGPWLGTLYVLAGSCLGFSVTFWVGRTLLRERARQWRRRHERLGRMTAYIEKHEALSVLLVRLVPVFPINLLSYGLGAMNVRFRTYFLVSLLAVIPGAAMYVGLGELLWRMFVEREGLAAGVVAWVAIFLALSVMLGYGGARLYRRVSGGGA